MHGRRQLGRWVGRLLRSEVRALARDDARRRVGLDERVRNERPHKKERDGPRRTQGGVAQSGPLALLGDSVAQGGDVQRKVHRRRDERVKANAEKRKGAQNQSDQQIARVVGFG